MAPLVDFQIANLCQASPGLVEPFNPEQLNPCSYDVRLGDTLLIESAAGPDLVPYPLHHHSEGDPYLLKPGQFALAPTPEMFNLPPTIAAQFVLKSSRAREGLQHLLAGWCDPGWHGSVLTMELKNVRQLHPIALWPGMRIGQMVFHDVTVRPERHYGQTGRYNGDRTVQGSKG
jgi:dCTP deaminase